MPFGSYKDFADCVAQNGDKADPHAYCGTIQAATEKALAHDAAIRKSTMTASVDGTEHPAGDFAYVPDPAKPSTWKFPIFDAAHARNALARFDQADLPAGDKAAVKAKIMAAAQQHGVDVSAEKGFIVAKVDEEQRIVFGWASVAMMDESEPVVDLQDDIIEGPTLEKAMYDYVRRYAVVNDMHRGGAVGDLVESFVVTPEKLQAMGLTRSGAPAVGAWVGFKLDEGQWDAYKRGERPMFPIEGQATHA